MLRFVCDYCQRERKSGESWILGIAAEEVAPSAARREVVLASTWDQKRLCHPLAVHFCSQSHAEQYIAKLFGQQPTRVQEEVIETTVSTTAPARTQRRVVRTVAADRRRVTSRVKRKPRGRAA